MPRMLLIIVQQNENHEGATWQSMPLFEGSHTNMDNTLGKFLQMCICRLHGKLGKELVVHQCFWSLAHCHNKALFGHLNKFGNLCCAKATQTTQASFSLLIFLGALNYPSGSTVAFQRSTSLSSLLLLYPISFFTSSPHICPLQSSWSFPSH